MKIIYEFDSVEDQESNAIFAQALKMHAMLCDLQDELRNCCKYTNPTKRDLYWRDRLHALLSERDIKLE